MTTVTSIIADALRESNIIPIGESPEADTQLEALRHLNSVIYSLFGFEIGEGLTPINYGGNGLTNEYGIALDDSALIDGSFVPSNTSLVLNLEAAKTVYLPPRPYAGARVGIVDASSNLNTYNLTINGNGRKIESATSVTLTTSGLTREWFYRDDLAAWVRLTDLDNNADSPFPREFDDLLITMLAMRLNPRYGVETLPETVERMRYTRKRFSARYKQKGFASVDPALLIENRGTRQRHFNDYRYTKGF